MQMQAMQQLLWASPPGGQQTLQWPAWKQGFFFSKHPGLQWGLVQRQGGPCGVLAAVQVPDAAFCSAHQRCLGTQQPSLQLTQLFHEACTITVVLWCFSANGAPACLLAAAAAKA